MLSVFPEGVPDNLLLGGFDNVGIGDSTGELALLDPVLSGALHVGDEADGGVEGVLGLAGVVGDEPEAVKDPRAVCC